MLFWGIAEHRCKKEVIRRDLSWNGNCQIVSSVLTGVARGNPGSTRIDGLLQNENRELMCTYLGPFGNIKSTEAEL